MVVEARGWPQPPQMARRSYIQTRCVVQFFLGVVATGAGTALLWGFVLRGDARLEHLRHGVRAAGHRRHDPELPHADARRPAARGQEGTDHPPVRVRHRGRRGRLPRVRRDTWRSAGRCATPRRRPAASSTWSRSRVLDAAPGASSPSRSASRPSTPLIWSTTTGRCSRRAPGRVIGAQGPPEPGLGARQVSGSETTSPLHGKSLLSDSLVSRTAVTFRADPTTQGGVLFDAHHQHPALHTPRGLRGRP